MIATVPSPLVTRMLIILLAASLILLIAGVALPTAFDMSPLFWTHLVVALGIMTLITAAMQYFVPVLTRSRSAGRWVSRLPLIMLASGGTAVAVFGGALDYRVLSLAAMIGLSACSMMLAWMVVRGRAALGRPHPGLDWYVAAMAFLLAGLAVAALIPWLPQWHDPLRAFHVHVNLYGFVGLTAIGTLQVLLPTAVGRPDPEVGQRLRLDLKWAVLGTLSLALGKAGVAVLVWPGVLAWTWVVGRMVSAWLVLFPRELMSLHGVGPLLTASALGFGMALFETGLDRGTPLTIFLPGFLMPLLSGAAGQLAPVWLRPGVATSWHDDSRRLLGRHGGVRAFLFLSSALLPLLGYKCSGMPGLTAILWLLVLFVLWLWRD